MNSLVLLAAFGIASGSFIPVQQQPQDCVYGRWTEFTPCSAPCGQQGTQSRTRRIVAQGANGGRQCDPSLLEEWKPCFEPCKVDCVMGPWSDYSQCQLPGTSFGFGQQLQCGRGQQQRSRQILVQPQNGGRQCGPLTEQKACEIQCDCIEGQWSAWSQCPRCGPPAQRNREREVIQQPSLGGRQCGQLWESEPCNIQECAVDCVMGPWSSYGQCQIINGLPGQTCGNGQHQRTRQILVQPRNGGRQCGPLTEQKACNEPCNDCRMGFWSAWSQCPRCGQATQRSRSRQILVQPDIGGAQCESTFEQENCQIQECPIDCVMSRWSQFSTCLTSDGQTCGISGQHQRTRSILVQPRFGGAPCGPLEEWETCPLQPCRSDCIESQWSQWSECQNQNLRSCGQGQRQRTRSILEPAVNGGRQCGELEQWEQCNMGPCPIDCVMGQWEPFGACSAPKCGKGFETRRRPVITQPRYGGRPCLFTEDTRPCENTQCFEPSCFGRPTEFHTDPSKPCDKKFWKCVNQQTHAHECPDDLYFNKDTLRCAPFNEVAACKFGRGF